MVLQALIQGSLLHHDTSEICANTLPANLPLLTMQTHHWAASQMSSTWVISLMGCGAPTETARERADLVSSGLGMCSPTSFKNNSHLPVFS